MFPYIAPPVFELFGREVHAFWLTTLAAVITGFLGAGKTTLVRHVLENANGGRIAIIVNEFGSLGIDGDLLKSCGIAGCKDEDIVELSNGCICCTLWEDLLLEVRRLADEGRAPGQGRRDQPRRPRLTDVLGLDSIGPAVDLHLDLDPPLLAAEQPAVEERGVGHVERVLGAEPVPGHRRRRQSAGR